MDWHCLYTWIAVLSREREAGRELGNHETSAASSSIHLNIVGTGPKHGPTCFHIWILPINALDWVTDYLYFQLNKLNKLWIKKMFSDVELIILYFVQKCVFLMSCEHSDASSSQRNSHSRGQLWSECVRQQLSQQYFTKTDNFDAFQNEFSNLFLLFYWIKELMYTCFTIVFICF